jgi:FdhD protein
MPDVEEIMNLSRSLDLTQVIEWNDGEVRRVEDCLVAEEPLEIRSNGKPVSVTMRTPGNDLELAAGFLFTEGILASADQIGNLPSSLSGRNLVDFHLLNSEWEPAESQRNFFAASSCGVCGKASIDAIRRRGLPAPNPEFRFPAELLCDLPHMLRCKQEIFGRTGALHAAGLFSASGELLVLREDVGRHNAVDKVVGWALIENKLPLSNCILMVSGRGGFEIVQKGLAAGIPAIASVSAPSSLAVRLARESGLTLVGFLRGRRFILYSGAERCEQVDTAKLHT